MVCQIAKVPAAVVSDQVAEAVAVEVPRQIWLERRWMCDEVPVPLRVVVIVGRPLFPGRLVVVRLQYGIFDVIRVDDVLVTIWERLDGVVVPGVIVCREIWGQIGEG